MSFRIIFIMNDTDAYRLEAVLALASAFPGSLRTGDIARQRGVPPKFLARLLAELARRGVVVTARGPRGGARLARRPDEVKVGEVLLAATAYGKGGTATRWLAARLQEAERRTLAPLSVARLLGVERQGSEPQYEI